jgi:hypothetical protein
MDFYRMPIIGPIADLVVGLWLILPVTLGILWFIDHRNLKQQVTAAECKYEMIDPIRAEAGIGMSDKCKCFWEEMSLEQLRKMK